MTVETRQNGETVVVEYHADNGGVVAATVSGDIDDVDTQWVINAHSLKERAEQHGSE